MTLNQSYAVFQPTIWSPRIYFFLKNRLVANNVADDFSDEVMSGGDTINIPYVADGFSAASIQTTNGSITPTNISDTKTALSINQWQGTALVFSDFQMAQIAKSYRLKESYMQAMGYAIAKKLDSDIIRLAADATITTVGNSVTALLSTTIEKAMSILSSRSVPLNECTFLMHPKTYYKRIFGIQKYYDASQYGKSTLPMGVVDYLYGVPVVTTQQVTTCTQAADGQRGGSGYRNLLLHKTAFAFAIGNVPGADTINGVRLSEFRNNGSDLATKISADVAYGTKLVNGSRVVKIIDKNT